MCSTLRSASIFCSVTKTRAENMATTAEETQPRSNSTSQVRTFPPASAVGFTLTDIFYGQSIIEGHQRRLKRANEKQPRAPECVIRADRGCGSWLQTIRVPIPQPERAMAAALAPLCPPHARRVNVFSPGKSSASESLYHSTSTLLVLPHCCDPHVCRVAPFLSSSQNEMRPPQRPAPACSCSFTVSTEPSALI